MSQAAAAPSLSSLHQLFVTILPRIEAHGHFYFRGKNPSTQEECVAEMVALCWKWFVRLFERGKDPTQFVSALATFAARAVNSGRRLCGQENGHDVLSALAQRQHQFTLSKLPDCSTLSTNLLAEALHDNTQTPPDEQAAFRIDFPQWLGSLGAQRRRVAEDLMLGERTRDVAQRHGLSASRISQMRREFLADWQQFCSSEAWHC